MLEIMPTYLFLLVHKDPALYQYLWEFHRLYWKQINKRFLILFMFVLENTIHINEEMRGTLLMHFSAHVDGLCITKITSSF